MRLETINVSRKAANKLTQATKDNVLYAQLGISWMRKDHALLKIANDLMNWIGNVINV